MFCKNHITLIGFLGKDAETRFTPTGQPTLGFPSQPTSVGRDKGSGEYKTRTEWHRIVVWGKFGDWAGSLKKGAFIEAEGELRYRDSQANGSDAKIRIGEIHAISILTLDRGERPSTKVRPRLPNSRVMTIRRSESGKAAVLVAGRLSFQPTGSFDSQPRDKLNAGIPGPSSNIEMLFSARVQVLKKRPEIPANKVVSAIAFSVTYSKQEKAANTGTIPVRASMYHPHAERSPVGGLFGGKRRAVITVR
jgi:single-strand DNA-binding protein